MQETLWYIVNFSFVWVLANIVVVTICWHERHRDVLRGMHSPLVTFCFTFRTFWLSLIVFVPMICLNDVFLQKTITGVALNTFPNVLLIFNICNAWLYVLVMSLMCFRVNAHSIVAWMSRNSLVGLAKWLSVCLRTKWLRVWVLLQSLIQCLLMVSLISGKIELCVTEKEITFFCTVSVLFDRVNLSKLSTFLI